MDGGVRRSVSAKVCEQFKVRVLFVTGDLDQGKGGPHFSLIGLANQLSQQLDITILGETRSAQSAVNWGFSQSIEVIPCVTPAPSAMHCTVQACLFFSRILFGKTNFDVVVYQTPWLGNIFFLELVRLFKNLPTIVFPRGSFSHRALTQSAFKKKVFMALLPSVFRSKSTAFVALSSQEAKQTEMLTGSTNVYVIPNATVDLWMDSNRSAGRDTVFLYFGRITAGKGIERLLDGWIDFVSEASTDTNQHKLKFVGPVDAGVGEDLLEQINKCSDFNVEYGHEVSSKDKVNLLNSCDYFVLLSESEGQSMAMLEALSCGLPCIITDECNYDLLVEEGAGWCLSKNECLPDVLADTPVSGSYRYQQKSKNARILFENNHSWELVAGKVLEVITAVADGESF